MIKNKIISDIEKELSILLNKLSEEEYIDFIESNTLLSIYDRIINDLEKPYILDEKYLMDVYQIIKCKNKITN